MVKANQELMQLGIPCDVFDDQALYIRTVREGLSGSTLKRVIVHFGHRDAFVDALGTTSSNFSRLYTRKHLEKNQSESVLEFIRIFKKAEEVFGDAENAKLWLESDITALGGEKPLALFDTFEGRKLVLQILRRVESGNFP